LIALILFSFITGFMPVAAAITAILSGVVLFTNTLKYDPELCINCGMCSSVCPHGVFHQNANEAQLVNPEACMECGACQLNCPTNAIKVDSGVGCAHAMMGRGIDKTQSLQG